jgi:hypothetical protein
MFFTSQKPVLFAGEEEDQTPGIAILSKFSPLTRPADAAVHFLPLTESVDSGERYFCLESAHRYPDACAVLLQDS